jgi:ABC-type branched-subunit amino acid transport system substrate-binding protein
MHSAARASLASVVATALVITANHLYTLGPMALMLGAVLVVVPVLLLWWFRKTRSRIAFTGYLMMNVWIVVGFGVIKGLWGTVLRLFLGIFLSSRSTLFPRPPVGTLGFEMSGVLTFIGSMFVLYYGAQFIRAKRLAGAAPSATDRDRHDAWLTTGALGATLVIASAYTFSREDRWTAPPNGIVKIGVIAPIDGPYALLGTSFVKAVQMANDDLKNTRYRYELVVRNSGPDPVIARAVIERVIREDKVAAIVGGISIIGQVTKPLTTQARIPHLCVCTVTSIGDGAYNFTNIPSPEAEGVRWVEEAKRRGITTVGIISRDYPSINNHVKAMKGEALRRGLTIASEQRFAASVTDFRPIIERARATTPDIYYVEALSPGLDLLGQQLADAKIANVASVVALSLSDHPELFEGMWYTDSNLRDIAFRTRFEEKYPGTRFATHMMPYAYDSFRMIVQAFERGENPAVYLRNMRTFDGTADLLTKVPRSGNFASTPAVWAIRDGRPVLLK